MSTVYPNFAESLTGASTFLIMLEVRQRIYLFVTIKVRTTVSITRCACKTLPIPESETKWL